MFKNGSPAMSVASSTARPSAGFARAVVRELAAGGITGIVGVTFAIAFAALTFSGPLAPYIGIGLGITFCGSAILATVIGLRSSFSFAAAGPDSNSSVIIALAGAAFAARLPPELAVRHFAAFIMLATLSSGTALLVFGALRLGRAVRFIPFPVVAGFMSTIGLLITGSALALCNGRPIHLGDWAAIVGASRNPHVLAGAAVGLTLFVATRRLRNPLTMPALVLVGIAITHMIRGAAGITVEDARALGWLFQKLDGIAFVNPLTTLTSLELDWRVMGDMVGYVGITAVAVTISVLLNETGIEAATERDADIDHELRWHGIANVIAAIAGGTAGNITLTRTMLNYRCGARTRLSIVAMVGVILLFAAFGRLVGYLPPFLLGGVLISLGLSIAQEWLLRTRAKLTVLDYGLVVFIAMMGVLGGVGLAVAAGIAAASLFFALACARLPVVRNDLSGSERRSRLVRPSDQARTLDDLGQNIRLLVLQGFFFFGTANSLVEHVRQHIASGRMGRSAALVLDFTRVTGLDSAGVFALLKVRQLIAAADGVVVLVGLTADFARALRRGGMLQGNVRLFEDADLALEWCEERALENHPSSRDGRRGFEAWLAEELGGPDTVALIKPHLRRQELMSGEILFSEGAPADALFFVEAGRVCVARGVGSPHMIRLRTTLECTIIGEVALYLGGFRTATVVADTPAVVHELTGLELARIEAEEPHLAIALHRMIVRIDAERLRFTTRVLDALH